MIVAEQKSLDELKDPDWRGRKGTGRWLRHLCHRLFCRRGTRGGHHVRVAAHGLQTER